MSFQVLSTKIIKVVVGGERLTLQICAQAWLKIVNPMIDIKFIESSNCIYYIKNQQDASLAVLFISNCKITLYVSDAFCIHHQEY